MAMVEKATVITDCCGIIIVEDVGSDVGAEISIYDECGFGVYTFSKTDWELLKKIVDDMFISVE